MIYGVLDTSRGVFNYCCGGHPPAILLREGQPPRRMEGRGTLLGVFDVPFEPYEALLSAGDRVVLYSDGVESIRWGEHGSGVDGLMTRLAIRDGRTPQALIDDALAVAEPGNGPIRRRDGPCFSRCGVERITGGRSPRFLVGRALRRRPSGGGPSATLRESRPTQRRDSGSDGGMVEGCPAPRERLCSRVRSRGRSPHGRVAGPAITVRQCDRSTNSHPRESTPCARPTLSRAPAPWVALARRPRDDRDGIGPATDARRHARRPHRAGLLDRLDARRQGHRDRRVRQHDPVLGRRDPQGAQEVYRRPGRLPCPQRIAEPRRLRRSPREASGRPRKSGSNPAAAPPRASTTCPPGRTRWRPARTASGSPSRPPRP